VRCSIVIATHNKCDVLYRVLESINKQNTPFEVQTIVVDDNSTDETMTLCADYPVQYIYVENDTDLPYRNPAYARNVGYRHASGDVIICQSDDVVHVTEDSVERLCTRLHKGFFNIATVKNYDCINGHVIEEYTGLGNKRPFFFLGSLFRDDLYAVGGNCEEFIYPGYDDNWFADCLMHGQGLHPVYMDDVVGWHMHHVRPPNIGSLIKPSRDLYRQKLQNAQAGITKWEASGGPWM
jgi:glycosyltransferase involved in cell wall biosynthesis